MQYLLSIAAQLELRSSAAIRLLADFISPPDKAVHFAHEVETFARSPFQSLEGWDSFVQYGRPDKDKNADAGGAADVRIVEEPRERARERARERRMSGGGREPPLDQGNGRRMSEGRHDDGPRGPLPPPPPGRGGKRRQPEPDWRERDTLVPPPPSARRRRRSERSGDRYTHRPGQDRRRSDTLDDRRREDEYNDDRTRREKDDCDCNHSSNGGRDRYRDRPRSRSRSHSRNRRGSRGRSRDLSPHQRHSPRRGSGDVKRARSVTPVALRSSGSPVLPSLPFAARAAPTTRPALSIFGRAADSIRPSLQTHLSNVPATTSSEPPSVPLLTSAVADKRALLQARLLAEHRTSFSAVRTAPAPPAPPAAPAAPASLRERLRTRHELERQEQSRAALVRAEAATIDWERDKEGAPGARGVAAAGVERMTKYAQDLKDLLLTRLEEEKRLASVAADASVFAEAQPADGEREKGATQEEKLKAALKRRLAAAKAVKEG